MSDHGRSDSGMRHTSAARAVVRRETQADSGFLVGLGLVGVGWVLGPEQHVSRVLLCDPCEVFEPCEVSIGESEQCTRQTFVLNIQGSMGKHTLEQPARLDHVGREVRADALIEKLGLGHAPTMADRCARAPTKAARRTSSTRLGAGPARQAPFHEGSSYPEIRLDALANSPITSCSTQTQLTSVPNSFRSVVSNVLWV